MGKQITMGMKLDIVKWGNSSGIRLPAPLLAQLNLRTGDAFEAEVVKNGLMLRPSPVAAARADSAAIEAMRFAVEADGGMAFIQCWLAGDFDTIRKEWPMAPKGIFAGAKK